MKLFFAALVTSFISFSASAQQCSDQCKIALLDAEFEFAYHSGASSTQIADDIYKACGQYPTIEKECAKKINPSAGSMTYLFYAGCVHKGVKKDCEERYELAR